MTKHNLNGFYERFYEYAPIGFYTTSIDDGTFVMANPTCVEMLGFDSFENMQKTVKSADLYPKEERQRLINEINDYGKATDFETEVTLPGGRKMWVQISGRKCEHKNCIEGSIIDITEKRDMEMKLKVYKRETLHDLESIGNAIQQKIEELDDSISQPVSC